MSKKLLFALTFIASFIFSDVMYSQKYWVMFKNKTGTPYTLSAAGAYLSTKAIQRRIDQGIALDNTDLPVTPSYVSQVDAVSGVTILYRSKWLNGVVISVTNTIALTTINTFSFVQTTNKVNKYKLTFPFAETNPQDINEEYKTQSPTAFNYGLAVGQNTMVGVDCLHNLGYRGQGMTIAVLDDGFADVHIDNIYDSLFLQNRLLGTRDFVTGDTLVFEDDSHGAKCLSTMAGCSPGTIIGSAPKAKYWLLRTEDIGSETISEEYNWIRGAEFADSVGADVCTTSLGYTTFDNGGPNANNHNYSQLNGKTAPMSIAATMAARKGMLVLNAAGNEGGGSWYYVGVPADADSIIAVGSVGTNGSYSGFSSHGPTSDGRIKPDLCAQGGPGYVCYSGCNFGNGTSFATPILAGAVTCLWQYKKAATNFQIMAALKATADSAATPNNRIGWGIPNMCAAASYSILSAVSVPSHEKDASVKIYPNPFNTAINISLNEISSPKLTVNVTNVLGQVLYTETFVNASGVLQLNALGDLPKGIYFVELSSPEINTTKKIVKQ
jgi:serine protease AprX